MTGRSRGRPEVAPQEAVSVAATAPPNVAGACAPMSKIPKQIDDPALSTRSGRCRRCDSGDKRQSDQGCKKGPHHGGSPFEQAMWDNTIVDLIVGRENASFGGAGLLRGEQGARGLASCNAGLVDGDAGECRGYSQASRVPPNACPPKPGGSARHRAFSFRVLCGSGQQHSFRAPQSVQRIAFEIASSGVSMSSRCRRASSWGSITMLCRQPSQCSQARLPSLASIASHLSARR
jgi:hypothetical protein